LKILVINPNTSECFNKLLKNSSDKYALSSTQVKVVSPKSGPEVIEGTYDEALSIQGALETFINLEKDYDAFIIACFSDHLSLQAIKEITCKPVVGIVEASIYLACLVISLVLLPQIVNGVPYFIIILESVD
jgi:allantoin racemase